MSQEAQQNLPGVSVTSISVSDPSANARTDGTAKKAETNVSKPAQGDPPCLCSYNLIVLLVKNIVINIKQCNIVVKLSCI